MAKRWSLDELEMAKRWSLENKVRQKILFDWYYINGSFPHFSLVTLPS